MSDAALLEFVARLTYNTDGLSAKLRLYFSQFLTFHFSKSISVNQIENIENKRAAIQFGGDDEMRTAAARLTTSEKCWAVAAIYFLQAEVERQDDRVLSRRLGVLAEEVTRILSLDAEKALIESERSKIDSEFRAFNERAVVRIPARIWPLFLDFFIRCFLLIYFGLNELNKASLTGLNVLFVTGGMLLLVAVYSRRDRRRNRRMLDNYGGIEQYQIEYRVTASQYSWLALFLGLSTFISYLLPDQLHAIAFLGLAFYYFIYIRYFCLGRISENDLVRQLEEKVQHTDRLDVDENDEMIVNLETQLHSSTSRLDAYVLESALFGALSFSGFLQIMASDLLSFTDLENFATNIFTASQALIHLQWDEFWHGLSLLNNKVSLFCLVSVESLVCSIFFLAVIASRLRFSDIADKVRTALNLARAFNDKEEAVYHESEKSDIRQSRLTDLTLRVNRQLFEANQSLLRVGPIVAYMEYFRNAGILVFLIILISSSLFITSVLGWIFLGLVAATSLYFNREFLNLSFRATALQLRVMFLRRWYWFFLASISPFLAAMVLRNSFYWVSTNNQMILGWLFVGLFLFAWISLASHYDEDFGEIEKGKKRRISRWSVIKYSIAVATLIYCLGMVFKYLHLFGADEIMLIGIALMSTLMYFTGYFLSSVKWLGLVCGGALGTACVGLLFKTLHLNGGNEMMLTGVIVVLICAAIVWWKKAKFHSLLLRITLVILFVTVTNFTGAFFILDQIYAHRALDLPEVLNVYEKHSVDYFSAEEMAEAIKSTEAYISRYGTQVSYQTVYQDVSRVYNNFGEDILFSAGRGESTPIEIGNAVMAVRERDKIVSMFNFEPVVIRGFNMGLEGDLLMAQGKRSEAETALRSMAGRMPASAQRTEVEEKLAAIISSVGSGN